MRITQISVSKHSRHYQQLTMEQSKPITMEQSSDITMEQSTQATRTVQASCITVIGSSAGEYLTSTVYSELP